MTEIVEQAKNWMTGDKIEPKEQPKAEPPAEDKSQFRQAVEWAAARSHEEHAGECGICSWRSLYKPRKKEDQLEAIERHIRRRHGDTIVELFKEQTFDLSASTPAPLPTRTNENDLLEVAGIADVEQLDRTDLLHIPDETRRKAELNGETFYWKRPEEVKHLKAQGARVVYTDGIDGQQQPSSEDGVLRARELVCMVLPHEVATQRRRQKEQRINDQLQARAEEVRQSRDEYEKNTYDYLRSERNLDHNQAERISQKLSQRRQREAGNGSSGSNLGISVTTNQGRSEY
jgi:DNA-directed RNA polymerase subunit RPC12/RpoP